MIVSMFIWHRSWHYVFREIVWTKQPTGSTCRIGSQWWCSEICVAFGLHSPGGSSRYACFLTVYSLKTAGWLLILNVFLGKSEWVAVWLWISPLLARLQWYEWLNSSQALFRWSLEHESGSIFAWLEFISNIEYHWFSPILATGITVWVLKLEFLNFALICFCKVNWNSNSSLTRISCDNFDQGIIDLQPELLAFAVWFVSISIIDWKWFPTKSEWKRSADKEESTLFFIHNLSAILNLTLRVGLLCSHFLGTFFFLVFHGRPMPLRHKLAITSLALFYPKKLVLYSWSIKELLFFGGLIDKGSSVLSKINK